MEFPQPGTILLAFVGAVLAVLVAVALGAQRVAIVRSRVAATHAERARWRRRSWYILAGILGLGLPLVIFLRHLS